MPAKQTLKYANKLKNVHTYSACKQYEDRQQHACKCTQLLTDQQQRHSLTRSKHFPLLFTQNGAIAKFSNPLKK